MTRLPKPLAYVAVILFVCLSASHISAQEIRLKDSEHIQAKEWEHLFTIPEHPGLSRHIDSETEKIILAEMNRRQKEVGDTMRTADVFYVWLPFFNYMRHEDPHMNVIPYFPHDIDWEAPEKERKKQWKKSSRNIYKYGKVLPVRAICIGDSVIVDKTLSPELQPGDLILSINGDPMSEMLKYDYQERHKFLGTFLAHYYMKMFCDEYVMEIIRDGKAMTVTVAGLPEMNDVEFQFTKQNSMDNNIRRYPESSAGYVKIPSFFPDNSRLIRILRKSILDFNKEGLTNIILDLRDNPGGYGSDFDKLLSMLINKPSIDYQKSQKLMVSKATLNDYDFLTENMIGQVIDIPDSLIIKTLPLDNELFIDGVKYYVMMDEGTASTAASFCNILQYNDAAQLVGEPLMHNALKYGECLDSKMFWHPLRKEIKVFKAWLGVSGISTTEFDEYTKAINGYLMPDIPIPYVAKEYMTGRDAVLDKLLEMIK